jgi:hypothetical protein
MDMKQPEAGMPLWERVAREYGTSPWAALARVRLSEAERRARAEGTP